VDTEDSDSVDTGSAGSRLWIDTHAHPVGLPGDCFSESCLDEAIETMEA
jgi:hypothetical protein